MPELIIFYSGLFLCFLVGIVIGAFTSYIPLVKIVLTVVISCLIMFCTGMYQARINKK